MVDSIVHQTDALIFGGGPAGASVALALLNYSSSDVILVEQSDFNQVRVGEQVSASIFSLMDYLIIDKDEFDEGSFIPSYSGTSYWGSDRPNCRDSIFTTEQASFQLDRERFDFKLVEQVVHRGGRIFPRTRCILIDRLDNGGWRIQLKHPTQGVFYVEAKFLVDATGRNASICKRLGAAPRKLDNLVGVGTFFNHDPQTMLAHEYLIEAAELGWWYSALLPNNTIVVTFFSDADIVSHHQLHQGDNWAALLQQTNHVKMRVKGAAICSNKPWVRNAASQITDFSSCKNFIAVGDAVSAFDPISSMGIGFAISTACQAASLIANNLTRNTIDAFASYQLDITNHFNSYLETRNKFYQHECRWPKSDFWTRRH